LKAVEGKNGKKSFLSRLLVTPVKDKVFLSAHILAEDVDNGYPIMGNQRYCGDELF